MEMRKPFYRAELHNLSAAIGAAMEIKRRTAKHGRIWKERGTRSPAILDPKFNQGGGAACVVIRIGLDGVSAPETCWPDYAILP